MAKPRSKYNNSVVITFNSKKDYDNFMETVLPTLETGNAHFTIAPVRQQVVLSEQEVQGLKSLLRGKGSGKNPARNVQ